MTDKKQHDWERIEIEYRAGVLSLRQIAQAHGLTHGAINKKAKQMGWGRDLRERIRIKAEAKAAAAILTPEQQQAKQKHERVIVEANAQAVADIKLAHRQDIRRARELVNTLLGELEAQSGAEALARLQNLGELMRNEGNDKLNEIYQAVIALPQRTKNVKLLVDSLKVVVDMERQAFSMDANTGADVAELAQATRQMLGNVVTVGGLQLDGGAL